MIAIKKLSPALAVSVAVLALACSRTSGPAPEEPRGIEPLVSAPPEGPCPLGAPGTEATVTQPEGAIDVTFTTKGNVDELRRRVSEAAAMYGPGAHKGEGHAGEHGAGQRHGLRLWQMPAARATVEIVDGGARLHLMPEDVAKLAELREALRVRVAELMTRDCR